MVNQRVLKIFCFCLTIILGAVSKVSAQDTEDKGVTKTLKFIEGVIQTPTPKNHRRLDTDFVGSILYGISTPLIDQLMDNIMDNISDFIQTLPSQDSGVTLNNNIASRESVTMHLSVYPPGSNVPPPDVSSQAIQAERQAMRNQFDIPFLGEKPPIGIGIGLDTFFVPPGNENSRFVSNLDLTWSFTKERLDSYNSLLKLNQILPGLLPIGAVKLKTRSSEFIREVGARASLSIDLKWRDKWHNNVAKLDITDLGMEIREEDVDLLGPDNVYHSDEMNITDIPGLVQELSEKVNEKLTRKAASSAAKEAGDSLAKKIFDKMEIGVLVTQITWDRKVTVNFELKAKDMNGKPIPNITLEPDTVVFDAEDVDHSLSIRIPEGCPPIKSLTLRVKQAVYEYKESGNVEIGVSAKYIPGRLTTGKITEGISKYFPNEHRVEIRGEDTKDLTVTGSNLVYVPFHGIVHSNTEPVFGIAQAKVEIKAKDNSFSRTEYTGPDGKFYGDFYIGSDSGVVPATTITVSKEGYAEDSLVKFINDSEGYDITKFIPSTELIQVNGRVKDANGNPIEEAQVHITSGNIDVWTATDSSGVYSAKVLKVPGMTFTAFKGGYNFPVISKTFAEKEMQATVDLSATDQMSPGVIKLIFKGPGASSLQAIHLTRASGEEFYVGIASDKTVKVPCPQSETLTLSASGFTFNPDRVTANFSSNRPGQEKSFDITVGIPWSNSVSLSPAQTTIETGGINYNDNRLQERAQLTATVKDISGNPMRGVPVRFEVVSNTQNAAVKFSQEGLRPGCGYGITDSQGKASVDVVAYNTLGTVTIRALALDKYIVTGRDSDALPSINNTQITIVPTTRISQSNKPTASVQVYTNRKAVLLADIPTVEKGGEFVFHLSHSLGNLASSPLYPSGRITAYKIAFSKDNGPWQEETYEGSPPLSIPRTFNEKGNYKVGYKVRETYVDQQIWSDRAEASFSVVEFTPPEVTLNVANTTATVNVPLNYSFNVNASAPLQGISLLFGDNNQDLILDSGILSGKTSWSANYHHTYRHEGTYTMTLSAIDRNGKTAQVSKIITVQPISALNDTVAPTGTVSINNGATSTVIREVVLHITGQDNPGGAGVYRFRVSNDGTNWGAWNSIDFSDDVPQPSITKDFSWQLSEGAGIKTVYVQLKDAAENVSNVFTDTIQLEAASVQILGNLPPPTATDTFYTNAPAPHGSISIIARNGNNLSVAFSATNDWAIEVNQMALSFDGTNWSAWMPFESNKQIDLSSHLNATKLYVIYGDRAGGQSQVYSAGIPPALVSATAQQGTQAGGQGQRGGGAVASTGTTQRDETSRDKGLQQTLSSRTPESAKKQEVESQAKRDTLIEAVREKMKKEELIDIAVEGLKCPPLVYLDQKVGVEAYVRNNSNLAIKDCLVIFASEDGTKSIEKISLPPRARERVKFEWTPLKEGRQKLLISFEFKDDINPENNQLSEVVEVKGKEEIDLSISGMRLEREIIVGQSCDIEVIVKNDSNNEIKECWLNFESEDGFKDKKRLFLRPRSQERIRFSWIPRRQGRQKIIASLEYKPDTEPKNNTIFEIVEVREKKEELKLSLKRLTLEGEKSGILPWGSPLIVNLDIDSSTDFEGVLEVGIILKGKENKEEFREQIKGLKRGTNSFKWQLLKEIKPDKYILAIEIINREAKIRENIEKGFEVSEK